MKLKYILTLTVVSTMGVTSVFAQTPDNSSMPPAAGKEDMMKKAEVSKMDTMFFKNAAQGGMAEVELSQLAESNASSQDVKDFAKMMVTDHTMANEKLMALAKSKNVMLSTETDKMHMDKKMAMSKMTGAEFDKGYLAEMLSDHEKTVAMFKKTAKHSDDADVKAFAESTLPTLEEHLAKVKMLTKS